MAGKQNSSKSTQRSARTPKKGAVRQHNRKPVDTMANTGLLDQMHQRSRRADFLSDTDQAAALVASTLATTMQEVFERDNWQVAVRPLVRDYIKSLTSGDGSKPVELASSAAVVIEKHFVGACFEHRIAWDTLPGQLQGWYHERTAKVRQGKPARPASPLSMPQKRELQAAS